MKFLWGLLVGFALGVAAGLLLAPQSGEATLAQLNEQGITLRRANEAMTQGRELYSRTKEELTEQYNKAKTGQM